MEMYVEKTENLCKAQFTRESCEMGAKHDKQHFHSMNRRKREKPQIEVAAILSETV